MAQVKKAHIEVHWLKGPPENVPVQYNPTELSFEKSAQFAEIGLPGLDAPLQQFVRGQAERLTLELFFDTTEGGMGNGATSVTTQTDRFFSLVKIEPERHAPPPVTFHWSEEFPGAQLSSRLLASQRRDSFRGIVESVRQRFTLFSSEGVPLRATLSLTLREYRPLDEQLQQLNLASPDKTHAHRVRRGDSLASISHRYYAQPSKWRAIADENGIMDPRRLSTGQVLTIPPTAGEAAT